MAAPTVSAVQQELITQGYGPLDVDGAVGPKTLAAVDAYRKDHGQSERVGRPIDSEFLDALFSKEPKMPTGSTSILTATIASAEDYFLNFITSKINWAAAAMVGLAVTWITTKFGITVPPDIQNWVTSGIITAGSAVIMWLRTFKNSPVVVTAPPTVVTKPN